MLNLRCYNLLDTSTIIFQDNNNDDINIKMMTTTYVSNTMYKIFNNKVQRINDLDLYFDIVFDGRTGKTNYLYFNIVFDAPSLIYNDNDGDYFGCTVKTKITDALFRIIDQGSVFCLILLQILLYNQ